MPAFAAATALVLAACGGGSSTGGGTLNSPFVGTYSGSTTVTVSSVRGSHSVGEAVSVYVHEDGLVQVGDAGSTVYASGPLRGNRVDIESDTSALSGADCSGTVTLSGTFNSAEDDGAVFEGSWSSSDASCFGVSGEVNGPFRAERVKQDVRSSRVFETSSPALQEAFDRAAR